MHLFLLLAPILHVTARITLFDEHKSVTSVPTFNFFEHRSNPYNVTGIACRMPLVEDPETQICKAVAPPALENNSFTQSFRQTIMYVHFDDAKKCGISTISQLFEKAYEILPLLAKAQYPPSKTLVIFTVEQYRGVVGCPIKEPYISRKISVPDSPPPNDIDVALVGGQNALQFLKALDETETYHFNVVQEADQWNALFLSFGYIFFNWSSIAVYIAAVIAVLKPALAIYEKSTIAGDLRNVIFWIAVLSVFSNFNSNKFLVSIINRPMGHRNYLRRNLETISNFLYAIAFHAVLYLWSVLFMEIQPSRGIYILQGILLLSVLSSASFSILRFISFNMIYTEPTIEIIEAVPLCILTISQVLLAIASIAFGKLFLPLIIIIGVSFHLRKKASKASPQTIATLTRLGLLGLVGFLGYGVIIIARIISARENRCEPVVMLATRIMRESSLLLCSVAILFVFGKESRNAIS